MVISNARRSLGKARRCCLEGRSSRGGGIALHSADRRSLDDLTYSRKRKKQWKKQNNGPLNASSPNLQVSKFHGPGNAEWGIRNGEGDTLDPISTLWRESRHKYAALGGCIACDLAFWIVIPFFFGL